MEAVVFGYENVWSVVRFSACRLEFRCQKYAKGTVPTSFTFYSCAEGIQFGGHFPFPNDSEGVLRTRFNECDDE